MKAKLIKVIERKGSSNGASRCYILCFNTAEGKSLRAWTDDRLGNFSRWYGLICGFVGVQQRAEELWLDGLSLWRNDPGKIDADSRFTIEIVKAPPAPFIPQINEENPEIQRKDIYG